MKKWFGFTALYPIAFVLLAGFLRALFNLDTCFRKYQPYPPCTGLNCNVLPLITPIPANYDTCVLVIDIVNFLIIITTLVFLILGLINWNIQNLYSKIVEYLFLLILIMILIIISIDSLIFSHSSLSENSSALIAAIISAGIIVGLVFLFKKVPKIPKILGYIFAAILGLSVIFLLIEIIQGY